MIEFSYRIIIVPLAIVVLAAAASLTPLHQHPAAAYSSTGSGAGTAVTQPKFLLGPVLQYVSLDTQVAIYSDTMDGTDVAKLREDNGVLYPQYVSAVMGLPGLREAEYTSSADIIANAAEDKRLGFDYAGFDIEPGLSPASDTGNVVLAVEKAAAAAHAAGLKFRATPAKAYTTEYGPRIARVSDAYHIQAQSLQDTCGTGRDLFKSYVDTEVQALKRANPGLVITVQESASQRAAPGLSVPQTMEVCFAEVAGRVDGTSPWFTSSTLQDLQDFVTWFHSHYS